MDHTLLLLLLLGGLVIVNGPQIWLLGRMTYRLERLYKLQAVTLRPIRPEQWRALLKLLLQSEMFDSPARRKLLLVDLPLALTTSLDLAGTTDGDLTEIVTCTARWSGNAFRQLLDNTAGVFNGSDVGLQLRQFRADWQL